ncbi:aldo/keto reductase [Roseisalinus antarcticus]|uniref:L-glyceraldehyde 3-phosphate reductase n=1 Tax=Roseisalinus antarcticus TaxID=254357 RepID=A0A1Y5T0P7_9RHOB|nr:aldo/keto reductase [Roseisalinus antarcticus]SLN53231.1 L-glyceraldehyde 3-phosphate reductase [Roseisalinus antarcticus]
MKYRTLGRSGLKVSQLCLGTMTFHGGDGMWKAIGQVGQDEADALVKTAFDAGINFVDTADVYSDGASETMLGQAIRNLGIPRNELVIATKAFGRTGEGPNNRGTSRYHLMDACKASLDRMGVDHIDLYQLHGFDTETPLEEQLEALHTLVQHGHVRYVGVSNWAAWQLSKALGIAERKGLTPIRSIQSYYTLAGRDLEREIVPALREEGVGLMVWSPLAGGYLSGKYTGQNDDDGRRASFDFPPIDRDKADRIVEVMRGIAKDKEVSVSQIALAWLLHQEVVTSVIVGAKRLDQLQDNIAATQVRLSDADLGALGEVSALAKEYPGWMFEMQQARHD